MKQIHLSFLVVTLVLVLSGCSSAPQTRSIVSKPSPNWGQSAELTQVPFFPQDAYQCGPAALATVLTYSGIETSPQSLVTKVYVPERQGSFQVEMLAASRASNRIPLIIEPTLGSLLDWLNAGQPVLTLQNLGLSWYPVWHYAVVVGYDLNDENVLLRSGRIERYVSDMAVFERTWRRSEFWAMVTLEPGHLPLAQNEHRYFQALAAYERHAKVEDRHKAWAVGLKQWPESTLLRMGYANMLLQQKKFEQAEKLYLEVIQRSPKDGPARNNLAELKRQQGDLKQAIYWAEQAILVDPNRQSIYQKTLNKIQSAM